VNMTFDTQHLLRLAHDKSAKSKSELADIVVSLFDHRGDVLSDGERALMFSIIHNLVSEVEISVRRKLCERLADQPGTPYGLIKSLTEDDLDVAYPILTRSEVLKNEDLIEIIHLRAEEYQLAVALREGLDTQVSDVLVETDNPRVISELLNNQSAKLSDETLINLVHKSKEMRPIQGPLLHRSELSEDMAKRMFMWVSAALRTHIVSRYHIDSIEVDRLLERAALEGYATTMVEKSRNDSELIKSLRDRGMITVDMMIQTLTEGETPIFFAIFSALTELSDVMVRRIVFDKNHTSLAVVCHALGLGELDFATIFRKTRRVAPGRARATREEVNMALEMYREIDVIEAESAVELWRRDEDYQLAIKAIQDKL